MMADTANNICSRFPNLGLNSQQAVFAGLINPIAGSDVVPLPTIEKLYSATEVGVKLGISANKVGKIANKLNIKNAEFGEFVLDKSRYSDKQVETFRYNDKAVMAIDAFLNQGLLNLRLPLPL